MKNTICFISVFAALVTGCASREEYYAQPNEEAELFKVVDVVTPTRVIVKRYKKYAVDLAYFYPSTVECSKVPEACAEIKSLVLDKNVWVERVYDRFGLPMHTLWLADLGVKPKQPINIGLIEDGGYSRMVDFHNLPNGKSELVSKAYDYGFNKYRLNHSLEQAPQWKRDLFVGELKK
ncbi:hypothetical protein V6259_13050 [Marinomonas sp. TI.3.20]|uniref:hypothetical protein n=1 Tax=Marinomonas sp. TI.3.20 TaxID=3121296 RepID=UPI00311EE9FB